MPIITVSEDYILYQQLQTNDLVCPQSQMREPMQLDLYYKHISTSMADNIKKKPMPVFYRPGDSLEIAKKDWTHEMKRFVAEQIKKYPVPNAGFRLTTFGKIWIGITVAAFLTIAAIITKIIWFNAPTTNNNKANFFNLSQPGDRYYGSFFDENYQDHQRKDAYTWIQVETVNAKDSICKIQLSSEVGKLTFETKQIDHTRFTGKTYLAKFEKDADKVLFRSLDRTFMFTSYPMDNKFKDYKISAKENQ